MDDIAMTAALRGRGLDDRDLLRLLRRGELTGVRRGAYAATLAEPLGLADQRPGVIRDRVLRAFARAGHPRTP